MLESKDILICQTEKTAASSEAAVLIIFSPRKAVSGYAVILFSRFHDGLLPLGLVQCVGVELGLQAHGAAGLIFLAVLAVAPGEIGGVDLNTGAVGVHSHAPPAVGIPQDSAGIAEHLKIVVIAVLQMQRLVIDANIPAQGLGTAEIHRRSCHRAALARGDAFAACRGKEPGGHGKGLFHGLFRVVMAGQIEIAVVGHVKYSVLVGNAVVSDLQAVICQRIGNANVRVAGETLIQVRGVEEEANAAFAVGQHLPQSALEARGAAVQAVGAVVGGEGVGFSAYHNGGFSNAVGVAAYGSAQIGVAGGIGGRGVKTQHHVCHITLAVRHKETHQRGAEVGQFSLQAATGYGI